MHRLFFPCCQCPVNAIVGQTVCNVIGSVWCLFFGFVTQTLSAATSVRDQRCLSESSQWCQISRGVELAPVWRKGRQDAGLENGMSAGKVLTHYPGTSNAVKSGQVACVTVKKVPIALPTLVVRDACFTVRLWPQHCDEADFIFIWSLFPQIQGSSSTILLLLIVMLCCPPDKVVRLYFEHQ